MSNPIGALVTFQWKDESAMQDTAYFSFGNYDDVSETDSFGVPDDTIFYYVDGGEDGLKEMMNNRDLPEYQIIKYELTYPMQEVKITSGKFPSIESQQSLYKQAEAVYFAVVTHLGLEDKCIKTNPDGSTENTPQGEELYYVIEDTLKGE